MLESSKHNAIEPYGYIKARGETNNRVM